MFSQHHRPALSYPASCDRRPASPVCRQRALTSRSPCLLYHRALWFCRRRRNGLANCVQSYYEPDAQGSCQWLYGELGCSDRSDGGAGRRHSGSGRRGAVGMRIQLGGVSRYCEGLCDARASRSSPSPDSSTWQMEGAQSWQRATWHMVAACSQKQSLGTRF